MGNMSVVLYDLEIERGAVVGPLVAVKGETLASGKRWHGIPTVRATEPGQQRGGTGTGGSQRRPAGEYTDRVCARDDDLASLDGDR